jgi:hypothetical protein
MREASMRTAGPVKNKINSSNNRTNPEIIRPLDTNWQMPFKVIKSSLPRKIHLHLIRFPKLTPNLRV